MTAGPGVDGSGLSVLIVDDNPVIRIGLRLLLAAEPAITVVAEANDGAEALALAARHHPDVVLLDVQMPGRGGLEVLPELARNSCVLMLTASDQDETIRAAIRAGARGYLVYGTVDAPGILASIRTAVGGAAVLSPVAAEALLRLPATAPTGPAAGTAQRSGPVRPDAAAHLSEREAVVMDLVAAGKSNAEIAASLYLAPKTVKNHINRIFAKPQVVSRAQAIALWLGNAGPGAG